MSPNRLYYMPFLYKSQCLQFIKHRAVGKVKYDYRDIPVYYYENDSKKGYANLTPEERKMVDSVLKIWHNHKSGKL